MTSKLKIGTVAGLALLAFHGNASADDRLLTADEVRAALAAPVVHSYSDIVAATAVTYETTTAASIPAAVSTDCPYVITYSDGTTDCLRQAVPDENTLFAKPRVLDAKVEFENNSSQLTAVGRQNLDTIISVVSDPSAGLTGARFSVSGHTNAVGSDAYNKWLSEQRAMSVSNYLTQTGVITSDNILAYGYGEDQLLPGVHPNAPDNRRVMIEVIK